jgi:hypothetical protein
MKYQIYEETFIHPGTKLLIRKFKGHPIVTLNQTLGLVKINLNYMPARAKPGEITDIVNRAMTDFNLPGTLHYGGQGVYRLRWIKIWNWKEFIKGEREVYLNENCGPDPQAVAMGIKEPSTNSYESPAHPIILTREDWTEIFYALEYKRDFSPAVDSEWIGHLNNILDTIGPDGDIAAASGVADNG